MKRLTFIIAFLVFTAFHSSAQIALEYTFSGVSASYIKLPVAGYKYYVMDVANNQCRLYNADHSLWKTINLSIPASYYLYDIQFVTENLFNADNSIELLYVSYTYNTSLSYYTYDTRIANENGTVLLSVPGGGYSNIYKAQNGSKLLVWVYDYSVSPSTVNTMVYTIPGQVVTSSPELPIDDQVALRNAFPNPTMGITTIPFTLPASVNKAELKVFNMNGAMVRSFIVDHTFNNIMMQTNDLPAGMYLYRIEADSFKSETLRLCVNK